MRVVAMVVCFMLIITTAACGKSKEEETKNSSGGTTQAVTAANTGTSAANLEHIDLTLELWGDKPNQMDAVLAEFEKRTASTLNMTLNINWTPLEEYKQKINLKLSAGEKIDFCFDAPWQNMTTFIAQNIYRDLTSYFNNPAYPGLKASFDASMVSNNLFNGKIMGVPITQSYGGGSITYLRGDLREKYGLGPINTLKDYENYLKVINEKETNMVPFSMVKTGDFGAASIISMDNPEIALGPVKAGVWSKTLAPSVVASFYIQDYKIIDSYLTVEPASELANFPAPYNKRDTSTAEKMREWYNDGYLEKDLILRDDARGLFTSGKAASFMAAPSDYNAINTALISSVPDAKLEVYIHDRNAREALKGQTEGNYQAWNFTCIPVTTSDEKTKRIMMFEDWMFTNRENHDLFEFGIEGVNWKAVGEDQFEYPDGIDMTKNYSFPWYVLTGNPNYIRFQAGLPDDLIKEFNFVYDLDSYYNPILSGFTFDTSKVKTQISNPDFATIYQKITAVTLLATKKDIDGSLAAIDKEVAANKMLLEDIDTIKKEAVAQCQAYLDTRKTSDEANGVTYPKK